jgi:3-phosphoshikimate 1-carboxyvinyltransferase
MPDNLSDCDDTEVIVRAFKEKPEVVDLQGAGTAMRFMTAYLSTIPGEHILTGTERMKHRPIGILCDALRTLGAQISYTDHEGFPPLRITGQPLEGGRLEMPSNVSSQYISALLMIGPMLQRGLELKLSGGIISRPYIDLTLCTMRDFGAEVEWTGPDTIKVTPKPYTPRPYLIENDWSAASYWYEMVALSPDDEAEVVLEGLMDGSKQGDSSVRYIFSLLGVRTVFETKETGRSTAVRLTKNGHCVPRLDYDFVNAPDLAQTIVVTCCALGVPFHFTGLQTLKIKETDRITALKRELSKMGFVLRDINGCELIWDGERCTPVTAPVAIETYDDHRMALAFAPLALQQPIVIQAPQVVRKSYPHFWDDLRRAGFKVLN